MTLEFNQAEESVISIDNVIGNIDLSLSVESSSVEAMPVDVVLNASNELNIEVVLDNQEVPLSVTIDPQMALEVDITTNDSIDFTVDVNTDTNKGDKGDAGEAGPQGPRGPRGEKGDRGDVGATGATGPAGSIGLDGAKGDNGDKGDIGLTGAKGDQGIQGNQGFKGDKGDTGPAGEKGDTGQNGLTTSVNWIEQIDGNITLTKADIGLGSVDDTSDLNKPISIATQNALDLKLEISLKGTNNGLAELDSSGFVKNSQLPSYVDDVLEYSSITSFPTIGESGKIYIDAATNLTYRWSGSIYALISSSLALGETSSTAYRGDRGKTAYDHSQSSHQSIINGTGFVKASGTTISYDNTSYLSYRTFGTAANNNTGDFYAAGSTVANSTKWNGYAHGFIYDNITSFTPTGIVGKHPNGSIYTFDAARTSLFLGLGSSAYTNTNDHILNQNSSAQSANIWINGKIRNSIVNNASFISNWSGSNWFGLGSTSANHTIRLGMTDGEGIFQSAPGDILFQVDGTATFASTVNATGYLLNGNNLTSSLSTNYIPKWNGSSFVNSLISVDGTDVKVQSTYNLASGLRVGFSPGVGANFLYNNAGNTTTSFTSEYASNSALMNFIMQTAGTPVTALSIYGSGVVSIPSTTPSTSPTTGALVVNGGMGVGGQVSTNYRFYTPGMLIGYWDGANNRIEGTSRPLGFTSYGYNIKFGFDGEFNTLLMYQATGNIGVGYTTDQGYKLAVNGSGLFNGGLVVNGNITNPLDNTYLAIGNDANIGFTKKSGFAGKMTFMAGSTFVIAQSNATNIQAYNTFTDKFILDGNGNLTVTGSMYASNFILSSDRTLKTNIRPIIKDYSRLNLVSFNFKDNLNELRFGTIAQDLLSNGYSEFVTGDKEGEYKVKYIDLIIAKLASAELRIKELEDKYGSR